MGFSVSGAAAIIFASMFIAFGAWYTASANSFEQVSEAEKDQADSVLSQRNTEVNIVSTSYDSTTDELTVTVNNTGAAQLSVPDSDLLVDGEYRTGWQSTATVDGRSGTDLWLGGEQLTMTVSATTRPDRVKVVADTGVADTAEV
jgi:flagellar protein FlaF